MFLLIVKSNKTIGKWFLPFDFSNKCFHSIQCWIDTPITINIMHWHWIEDNWSHHSVRKKNEKYYSFAQTYRILLLILEFDIQKLKENPCNILWFKLYIWILDLPFTMNNNVGYSDDLLYGHKATSFHIRSRNVWMKTKSYFLAYTSFSRIFKKVNLVGNLWNLKNFNYFSKH